MKTARLLEGLMVVRAVMERRKSFHRTRSMLLIAKTIRQSHTTLAMRRDMRGLEEAVVTLR